jgi:hypothetical protein
MKETTMARAWSVSGLRADMRLQSVARRVLAVRIAEFYSYAPFIHDPARVTELHDMRIAAKRLRYTLEIFKVCFPVGIDDALAQVRGIQELLGEIHDADVLVPFLSARLDAITAEERQALEARLHEESKEQARLATIAAALQTAPDDRRVGIYALLGRTLHRRRRRYAQFLDLWAQLETRDFRGQLDALCRRPLPEAGVNVEMLATEAVVGVVG